MWVVSDIKYFPTQNAIKYDAFEMGFVSADNRAGSSPISLSYELSTDKTFSTTLSASVTEKAVVDAIVASVEASVGLELSASVTVEKGTKVGAGYSVPPGKRQKLTAYKPGATTKGSVQYYWWDAQYQTGPEPKDLIKRTVPSSLIPLENGTHFVVTNF